MDGAPDSHGHLVELFAVTAHDADRDVHHVNGAFHHVILRHALVGAAIIVHDDVWQISVLHIHVGIGHVVIEAMSRKHSHQRLIAFECLDEERIC